MRLVAGPFHPDLERAFARKLGEKRKSDLLAVVAPSQRLADRLKEVAAESFPHGIVGVRFFNLNSFARSILDSDLPAGWTILEEALAEEKLVLELVERHFARAPYLSLASRIHRTARALLSVLHELQDAAVDSEAAVRLFVEEIREALSGENFSTLAELESPRVAEILSLYHRFSRELRDRRMLGRHDVASAAASSRFVLPYVEVLYYGFTELVQSQLDLFRAVCARVPVTVFYPWADAPAWEFARRFFAEVLRPLADSVEVLTPSLPEPLDLFRPDRKPPGLVSRSYTVSGVRDELWIASKEIVRWRDRGVRRIGVVARTLDPYAELLESVFRDHAIPFQSSAERTMLHDPYVKAARLLLALHERDWSREDVMDFLSSPAARIPEGAHPAEWDRVTRECGIGHGREEWRSRLRGQDAALLASVESLFELGSPPVEGTWPDLARWVRAALERLEGPPPVELAEAIASLEKLEAVRPRPAPGELADTLRTLVERLRRPVGGEAGVFVLDAMAARGIPFDALVILGMNERVFPRYILQDPFLQDGVRSRLTHRLGNRLPLKTAGYDEEKLLFASLLGSAPEIVLVRRRSDEEGRVQVPSIFLSALELPPDTEVPRPPRRKLEMDVVLTPREASVREHFRPGAVARIRPLAERRGWPLARLERSALFLEELSGFGAPTRYDGHVGEMREHVRGLSEYGISPTALERLARCPFQYFVRRVLDLESLDEPESEAAIDALESGGLYHRALEFALKDSGSPESAFDRACRELEAERTIRYPLLWETVRGRMKTSFLKFLEADEKRRGTFRPALFEEPLEGRIAGMRFQGRADRVDLRPDGGAFRVVDYKRRRSDRYPRSMEKGIFETKDLLQAAVYYLLAAQRFPEADLAASESLYAFLEDEPSFLALPEDFAARRSEFEKGIRSHLDRIRSGRFGLRIDRHCSTCDFRWVCRRDHIPTRRRAEVRDD